AYDASYNVATGYTGTIHFTSTDGAAILPLNYTFTGGDAGVHTFTGGVTLRTAGSQVVTATDVADVTINGSQGVTVGPPAPTGLIATAVSTTQVNLSWSASSGATQYDVVRLSASSGYTTLITTASTSYSDSSVTAGGTYVYKVRAIDASARLSGFSTPDAATTIFFTDDPLAAGTTTVQAIHVTELRQAVNAMRATAGLGAMSFADSVVTGGVTVKALHLQELRTALTQARTALGLTTIAFTDPTLTVGTTLVKVAHFQELRGGVK
ncbi:MAG TPA: fibronectin type III domain-containing protein, partial [Thermoanaerobaculia bacterium]|nr:fibronectin type III domain-containing protein [Thermoanaerobaculia bacterium]